MAPTLREPIPGPGQLVTSKMQGRQDAAVQAQSKELCAGKGREGPELNFWLCLVSCVMSGKLIALGLRFLFCTIRVIIPTLQGGCCKD